MIEDRKIPEKKIEKLIMSILSFCFLFAIVIYVSHIIKDVSMHAKLVITVFAGLFVINGIWKTICTYSLKLSQKGLDVLTFKGWKHFDWYDLQTQVYLAHGNFIFQTNGKNRIVVSSHNYKDIEYLKSYIHQMRPDFKVKG